MLKSSIRLFHALMKFPFNRIFVFANLCLKVAVKWLVGERPFLLLTILKCYISFFPQSSLLILKISNFFLHLLVYFFYLYSYVHNCNLIIY